MIFLTDVNISGFLSFVLAAGGMVFGSLLTQRSHPPVQLVYPAADEAAVNAGC